MEGVLERAWNHPPLDKCLELVEDSTERSTRGVTERWARGFLLFGLTECTKFSGERKRKREIQSMEHRAGQPLMVYRQARCTVACAMQRTATSRT